jgi:hypothetical protein
LGLAHGARECVLVIPSTFCQVAANSVGALICRIGQM